MKTINKMKAAISILVAEKKNDRKIFNETLNLWIQDSTIMCCSSSEEQNKNQQRAHDQKHGTNLVKLFLDKNIKR